MHLWTLWTETVGETVSETVAQAAQQTAATGDEMGTMLSMLLLVMMLGCGVYCIYTYIRLRKECYLFPNKFLYPGNCKPEECADVEGFIDFILPKILFFGILLTLCGAAYGLLDMVWKINHIAVNIGSMLVPLALFVWYILVQRKAANLYW